jgi:hypothetical protein
VAVGRSGVVLSDLADIVNATASFIVAFVLSAVAILVSSLIHEPVVLVLGWIVLRTTRA